MTAPTIVPPDGLHAAACELIARYGASRAIEEATRRADGFARAGRWPDHALALRVLTVVEQLAGRVR